MGTYAIDIQTLSIGLLLVRIAIGVNMAAHGAQKLLGWFGGYGLRGTGGVAGEFVNLAMRRGPAVTARAQSWQTAG